MKIKKGDKIKGFKFEKGYIDSMNVFVGEIGIVQFVDIYDDTIRITFKKPYTTSFWYPLNHPSAKRYNPFKNKLK